jgi:Spy/CpxP family protein refolding chaperone
MQRMKTELGLTDDQATKIRAIYEEQFGSLRQQMGDSSVSREDRRAAFEKARAAATSQIEQILTPEQKPKWEAYQKEAEQRRSQRRQGGGGGNN